MAFELTDRWVWDSWVADDGELFHLFYLSAPRSLGDPELRHRNAEIGHATSADLTTWTDHGIVIRPGMHGSADASASWTGSVVRGPDGWRMLYTGSRFPDAGSALNIESIVAASSGDLHTWTPEPLHLVPDREWYERIPDGTWHEEAWRDPWVYRDPAGDGWHMLVTARSRAAGDDPRDRGVVGHATSPDLAAWTVAAPLSEPGSGFAHLEVLQLVRIGDRDLLLFSCDAAHLAGSRAGGPGGVWAVELPDGIASIDLARARLLTDRIYAARAVQDRDGAWWLIGFESSETDGFGGRISDPQPLAL
jgi:beta-fructofuranosidase